jgi:hypothetical protein
MAVDKSFLERKKSDALEEATEGLADELRRVIVDAMEAEIHPTYIVGCLESIKLELQVALFQAIDEDEDE